MCCPTTSQGMRGGRRCEDLVHTYIDTFKTDQPRIPILNIEEDSICKFVEIVQTKSACCMYTACPNAWGEEGGEVGQEGQHWKQYTLLKESESLDCENTFNKMRIW